MIFKHFRVQCVLRSLLLAATICCLFFLESRDYSWIYIGFLAGMAIFQVYRLIRYIEQTRIDMTRFLEAIRYEDFSQVLRARGEGRVQEELFDAFNEIFKNFQQAKTETETQYRYLQTIVQHVGIGLLTFRTDGTVELINNAAKRLLGCSHLRMIQDLSSTSPELENILFNISSGRTELIKIDHDDSLKQLIIYGNEFIMREKKYKIVSIQNIQSELEEKEMEAWQNLIRVLTHEIMNSITPIASLASTAKNIIETQKDSVSSDNRNDIQSALKTIEKRSNGLMKFVCSYRKLTYLPSPDFQIISLKALFDSIEQLLQETLSAKGVNFQTSLDPHSLEITADPDLIAQVLINLINNSIEAVADKSRPAVTLKGSMNSRGRPCIQVEDNGVGLLEEVQSKIFIPFFTTKKTGTGIGLSLARQIMRMHRGTISVCSDIDKKTIFTLSF